MPDFSQLDQEVRAAFRLDFDDVVVRGTRQRSRSRRRVAVLACGLAVLVASGGVVAMASSRDPAQRGAVGTPSASASAPVDPPLVMPDLTRLKTLAEVWPQAVRRLPDRLPDGATYKIVKAIGGDKYLVHAKKALWVYDVPAGKALRLMDEPRTFPYATVSGGWVLRVATVKDYKQEITAVRLTGGTPVRVATGESVHGLPVVVNGDAVWAQARGDLMRAPVTGGGPVTQMRDGIGWVLDDSVWAAKYESRDPRLPNKSVLAQVWNLQTGQRREFRLHPDVPEFGMCSPEWCLARSKSGKWAVQRLDGSRYAEGSGANGLLNLQYTSERFISGHVQLPDNASQDPEYRGWHGVLWDIETGRAAYGGGRIDSDGFWEPRPESRTVPLDNDSFRNTKHHILDLTAL